MPVRMALLKGRSSYLCLYRMELARQDAQAQDRRVARVLAKVEDWSHHTQSGDLAELTGLDDRSPVIPLVTSTRENCLGSQCPQFRPCHVHRARREALAADIVVINHHLFFADVAVRESGMAELLPTVRVVVFDEAHQINETGVQFLGTQLSTGQVMDFSRDLLAAGLQHARGLADWVGLSRRVELSAQDLRLVARTALGAAKLRWAEDAPEGIPAEYWHGALRGVALACAQAQEALDTVSEIAPDFVRLYERGSELLARLARFSGPGDPEVVRWVRKNVAAQLPILFVTNRQEERDIVEGLASGADDFMVKPVRIGELNARVAALLRRAYPESMGARMAFGAYCFDADKRSLSVHG
eukprot:gene19747-39213_t